MTEAQEQFEWFISLWHQHQLHPWPRGWGGIEQYGFDVLDLEDLEVLLEAFVRKRQLSPRAAAVIKILAERLGLIVPRLPLEAQAYFGRLVELGRLALGIMASDKQPSPNTRAGGL